MEKWLRNLNLIQKEITVERKKVLRQMTDTGQVVFGILHAREQADKLTEELLAELKY